MEIQQLTFISSSWFDAGNPWSFASNLYIKLNESGGKNPKTQASVYLQIGKFRTDLTFNVLTY